MELCQHLAVGGYPLWATLLVAAMLCVLLDAFVSSDVLTHVGYVLIAIAAGMLLPVGPLLKLLLGTALWFVVVAGHYWLWRNHLESFAHRVLAPKRYWSGGKGLIGESGTIELENDRMLVKVVGELWPARAIAPVEHGVVVTVVDERDGVLLVEPKGA